MISYPQDWWVDGWTKRDQVLLKDWPFLMLSPDQSSRTRHSKEIIQMPLWTLWVPSDSFWINALATFQSCMNHVFNKQLWKFVLVFFDDILIYSRTWEEHLQHLDEVLEILEEKKFYAKIFKCEFGMKKMLYLGHIIRVQGFKVHQENIEAILNWSTPKNVTKLRIFLSICTYYRRFVKGYSQLKTTLTDLTKRGAFL